MNVSKLAATLAVALSASAFATPIELVENGSFEIPRVDSWATFPDIPGWRASEGGLEIQPSGTIPGINAFEGRQYAELDTYVNSAMWQNLNTVAGEFYKLTFAYMPRPDNRNADSNKILAYWNGTKIDMEIGWKQDDWSVVVIDNLVSRPGGGSQLMFMAGGQSDSFGGFVDGVSVTARTLAAVQPDVSSVPEPSTYAMLLTGLLAVGVSTRRKVIAK